MKENIYLSGYFLNKDSQDVVHTYKIYYKKDQLHHMDFSISHTTDDIFRANVNWLNDAPAENVYAAVKRILVRFLSTERAVNGLYRDMFMPSFKFNEIMDEINKGVRFISIEGNTNKYKNYIPQDIQDQYVVKLKNLFI